jgi:hypothetical protein
VHICVLCVIICIFICAILTLCHIDMAHSWNQTPVLFRSDDICLPQRFARQVQLMNRFPAMAAVGASAEVFHENRSASIAFCFFTASDEESGSVTLLHPQIKKVGVSMSLKLQQSRICVTSQASFWAFLGVNRGRRRDPGSLLILAYARY